MSIEETPKFGFEAPRPAVDITVAELYEKYNLGEAPSLADIELVVKHIWDDFTIRMDAIQLTLGRRVDSSELSVQAEDPTLRQVGILQDSGDAFACLLLMRGLEQQPVPADEQNL